MKTSPWILRLCLAATLLLLAAVYFYAARSGMLEELSTSARETYYNLQVRGWASGQSALERAVPAGLARLPDPYDPASNAPFRLARDGLHDLSYFRGRLYLYFGATPALVLFGPWAALTRHFLFHREATFLFCSLALLLSVGLVRAAQRRYFPATGTVGLVLGAWILGLGTGIPILLARSDVYEVAISCGYFFTVATWAALWGAWHRPERRGRWLALASVSFGLAVGARPSLLPGAIVLLLPVFFSGEGKGAAQRVREMAWAGGPLALLGVGLLVFNHRRFGEFSEFGQHYQLASDRQDSARHFDLSYLWFNLRAYLWEPARWHAHFPFVHRALPRALPPGHQAVEDPFGALVNLPVLLCAAAVPLAWSSRRAETALFRRMAGTVALSGGAALLTLGLFYGSCSRYEMEFLPALGLLAAWGVLALEQRWADQPRRRTGVWLGAGLLLLASMGFSLADAAEHYAEANSDTGMALIEAGRLRDAITRLRQVEQLDPELVGVHVNLGSALGRAQRLPEAIAEFTAAVQLDPSNFSGQFSLGLALEQVGRMPEAIAHYQAAVQLQPRRLEPHYRLGNALGNAGQVPAAMEQYREALRILPGFVAARANLGLALAEMGRPEEAIAQLEQALRDGPGNLEAEAYLGYALAHAGRWDEAIEHYEQVLRRHPDNAEVRYQWRMAQRHRIVP